MLFDGVQATTITTGVGSVSLDAVDQWGQYGQVLSDGDQVPYAMRVSATGDFEIGMGTYRDTNQLERTLIIATFVAGVYNNTNPTPINLPVGTKTVWHTQIANLAQYMPAVPAPALTTDRILVVRDGTTYSATINDLLNAQSPTGTAIAIPIAAQSNGDGWAPNSALAAQLQGPQSNARIWFNNEWQILEAGVNNKFTDLPSVDDEHGPEMRLMNLLAAQYSDDTPIYLIKYAVDATGLDPNAASAPVVWDPNTSGQLYDTFVNNYALAALNNLVAAGNTVYVPAMIWMQGENDSQNTTSANNYETNLTAFISAIRADLNLPQLPFIFGRIHDDMPTGSYPTANVNTVRAAMAAVAAADDDAYMIDTDNYSLLGDSLHFDAAGQESFATDIANIIATLPGNGIQYIPANGTDGSVVINNIAPGDTFTITVTDADLNTDSGTQQTVEVTLQNDTTNESETVTLTETGNDTGVFTGTLTTTDAAGAGTDDDGDMNVQDGQTVTVTYVDLNTSGGGSANRTDQANVAASSGFVDDFNRADNAAVGNGWIEKTAATWDIFNNTCRKAGANPSYYDNLVYRPAGENVLDVEASLEFNFSAGNPGWVQVFVRMSDGGPGEYNAYVLYINNATNEAVLGRQVNGDFVGASPLTTIPISPALSDSDLNRLRLRAVGTNPVVLDAWVERWNGSSWIVLGNTTVNHSAANRIQTAGSIGFTGYDQTSYSIARVTRDNL